MKRLLLSLVLIAAIPLIGVGVPVAQEEKTVYWSLMPETSSAPSGHLLVRIPAARVAPSEWNLNWYLYIYTPKGLRLPLGCIEDRSSLGDGSRIVLKLPPGTHRIEITRPAPSKEGMGSMGAFVLEKGKWTPWDRESIFVGRVDALVLANQVRILDIKYRNPQAMSKTEGKTTTRVFVWENLALAPSIGQAADLPKKNPKPYPLMQDISLKALDQPHLIAGLKAEEGKDFAEIALLHVQKPQLEPILTGLSDKSITLSWRLARVLVAARDPRAVPVLTGILQDRRSESKGRAPAAWALGELGDARPLDALKAALHDPEAMVRNYAVLALGQLKEPGTVPRLIEATRDTSGYTSVVILITKGESPGFLFVTDQGVFPIEPIPFYVVRMNAIYALGQVGDPAAVDPLIGFLTDHDLPVRLVALQGLGNYEGAKVIEALKSKLSDQQSVRFIAVHLLAKRGDASVLNSLDKLAKEDPDADVREAAKEASTKIRKKLQSRPK
jgi:HEAT repeat protein